MKTILMLFHWLLILPGSTGNDAPPSNKTYVIGNSRQIFTQLFKEAMEGKGFNYEQLCKKVLPKLEGKAYGSTNGKPCPADKTLVNFESFDCVTLVESFWALTYTVYEYKKQLVRKQHPFIRFTSNLNKVRYFGEENCGLSSRIHYFTQQMHELERKGLAYDVGTLSGKPFQKAINYVSTHRDTYSAGNRKEIRSKEKVLAQAAHYYYPKWALDKYFPVAKTGDIIGFSSREPGLDVAHTGIVIVTQGRLKLVHASSRHGEVVYAVDLEEYLNSRSDVNGILAFRPLFR